MIDDILKELWASDKPVAKAIHKSDKGKCIGIGMKAGMEIKTHKANVPTTLLVIKGSIKYIEGDKMRILSTYEQYAIPVGELHAVEAIEEGLFLLIQV